MHAEDQIKTQHQNEISTAVKNGNDIVFVVYSLMEKTEKNIKFALAGILEKHKRLDLFTPVYSCLKELITNAMKANIKRILVEEGEIKNSEDRAEAIAKIRSLLNKKKFLEYGLKAKKHSLSTRIYFRTYRNNLYIEVINNTPLTEVEIERINTKIKKSSEYDNIATFFIENPDPEAEGMGLGLSMIVVILKNIHIALNNFSVTTDGSDNTTAKMLIPLN